MNPADKVVILTGATEGIGLATAHLLARTGCKLALAARTNHRLLSLAAELEAMGYTAIAIPTDMGDTRQAATLARIVADAYGTIDIVINNAAIGVRDEVLFLSDTEARRVMDVNYFGPVALIQGALPYLKTNHGGGLVINISSIVGRRAMPGIAGYCASKAALEKMAESLRIEVAPDNVRVSTVYPGVTATRFNENSLGSSAAGRGRLSGVMSEKVAAVILKTIRREPRDAFITLFDRTFVTTSMLFPALMDWMLRRYVSQSGPANPEEPD
jgi:short-subunit dehydrogenase